MLVSSSRSWASVLRIYDPDEREVQRYVTNVLPFGATAAVFGFNRFARALCIVGVRVFKLLWVSFFDDLPHLAPVADSIHAERTSEAFLELVGWRYSKEEKKRRPFNRVFTALGV